ncbi:DUF934 domain-containing protein [Marinobacterium sedimentorum]|jgi:uncharacterized protein (DUF934 family)|uniref:DUF934 domain-containing protein n=1 Tax=Marinobacterium sedimentorum TaxID=2927804 RepID=UPI0020C73F52|nr:DUF934 domain-containing protein [Marinobacterium sedimentorum]MCP8689765.1 DUF934 domain-containing protein [Marinobacterium sedimentorum]
MPLLINREVVAQDSWQFLDVEATLEQVPQDGDIVVPLALYLENRDSLNGRAGRLGVQFNGDDNIEPLLADLSSLALVAIEFPVFRDGRGFSQARLVRRAGFAGQLRAVGDVTRDRLDHMQRCGFDALAVPEDRFKPEVLNAFGEVSVHYQAGADDPRPIYRQG